MLCDYSLSRHSPYASSLNGVRLRASSHVVGVKDAKKLMEDMPNKIQSGLGIVADVNKHTKDGKDYLEIKVEPSSFPISYHGEFHYRSGATKQQLTGIALTEFIKKKTGVRWEDITVDGITVDDLDADSFKAPKHQITEKHGTLDEAMVA